MSDRTVLGDTSRFIGRSDELATLAAALERALAGSTTIVLVRGDAGIGKTRLLEEVARLADIRLVPVAWGRSSAVEGAPPFWPWREVLRARSIDGDGGAAATAEDRFVLFEQLCDRLTDDADQQGLVVFLEDLHWADLASLHLLHHLAERRRDTRLLVVGSVRRPAPLAAGATELLLGIGRLSDTTSLDLGGFDAAAIRTQLVDLLGEEPDPALVERLVARTGGNPLFVREMGRVLSDGSPDDESPIPDAIRLVIGQRLDQLTPATRATVAVAAVVGADIQPDLVARLTEQPVDLVLDQLAEAASIGIVRVSKRSSEIRFAHDLMRDRLEDDHLPSASARLHLRIAEELAASGDDRRAEIAHHLLTALPVGDADAAVAAAVGAAATAMDQLAFEDAAALYRRALAVRTTTPAGPRRGGAPRRRGACPAPQPRPRRGDGRLPRERPPRPCGRRRRGARTRGAGAARRHRTGVDRRDRAVDHRGAGGAARGRLIAARPVARDARGRVRVHGAGRRRRAQCPGARHGRAARRHARAAAAYRGRQLVRSGPDGIDDRFELSDRMLALGRDRGMDEHATVWGHLWRLDVAIEHGRLEDAEAELHQLDALATRMRKPHIRWHVDRGWAGLWLGRGRFREALELAEHTNSLPTIFTIARVTGDRLRAEFEAAAFVPVPSPFAAVQRLSVAEYALATDQRDRAEALYADAPFPGSVPQPRFLLMPITTLHLAVAIELDDSAAVEACYQLLLPYRRFHNVGGAGAIVTLGSLEVPLGRAARYLGRTGDAIEHLRVGRAIDLEAGLVPFAAEASLELALALLDTGTPAAIAEAQALIEEAGAVAARLGMKPLAVAVERATAAPSATSAPSADPLSAHEREIAALVAEGLTNKQIAETAHISERTAENHVQHILTKLGFNTRSQIAVWFTQQQLR